MITEILPQVLHADLSSRQSPAELSTAVYFGKAHLEDDIK